MRRRVLGRAPHLRAWKFCLQFWNALNVIGVMMGDQDVRQIPASFRQSRKSGSCFRDVYAGGRPGGRIVHQRAVVVASGKDIDEHSSSWAQARRFVSRVLPVRARDVSPGARPDHASTIAGGRPLSLLCRSFPLLRIAKDRGARSKSLASVWLISMPLDVLNFAELLRLAPRRRRP